MDYTLRDKEGNEIHQDRIIRGAEDSQEPCEDIRIHRTVCRCKEGFDKRGSIKRIDDQRRN